MDGTRQVVLAAPPITRRSVGRRLAIVGSLAAAVLVLVTAAVTRPRESQPRRAREVARRADATPPAASAPISASSAKEPSPEAPTLREALKEKSKQDILHSHSDESGAAYFDGKAAVDAPPRPSAKPRTSESVDGLMRRGEPAALGDLGLGAGQGQGYGGRAAGDGRRLQRQRSDPVFGLPQEPQAGERYDQFAENRVSSTNEQPLSTFSIDVDTASYANVRRFLSSGRLPPPDAVRIEEMVNYFRYDYPQPAGDRPFSVTVEAAECPWSTGRRLVRIGLQGHDIDRRERPAGNLVFLIDVSGSMGDANKLPLVKQALAMLVDELTENDSVAIVTYAGDAGLKLPATSGDQKGKILAAIESL